MMKKIYLRGKDTERRNNKKKECIKIKKEENRNNRTKKFLFEEEKIQKEKECIN